MNVADLRLDASLEVMGRVLGAANVTLLASVI
jgi:hypothetical protein